MVLAFPTPGDQAHRRLWEHRLAPAVHGGRPLARDRLEERVGRDLAGLLVFALSGCHGRPRACLPGRRKPKRRM